MFNSQVSRNVWLALAAAAVLTAAGCSAGSDEASKTAQQAPATKPAAKPNGAAKPSVAAKSSPASATKAAAVKPVAAAEPTPAAKPAVAKVAEPKPMVTVPKGTAFNAMVGQTLATDKNKVGDTFSARLTEPIQVGGKTVIPKGAHVTGRIVTVKRHELKVTLASVVIHGKSYPLNTNAIVGPKSQPKSDTTDADNAKANKNVTLLAAKSQLKFRLAKPVSIPAKG